MIVKQPSRRLRDLVQKTGRPYGGLAAQVNERGRRKYGLHLTYGAPAVSQWINQGTRPRPDVQAIVAEVLSEKLGRPISAEDIWPEEEQASQGAAAYATLDDMDRRTVLLLIGQAVGGLAVGAEVERLAKPADGLAKADAAGVDVLQAGIANCRRLDDCFGSRAATRPALAQHQLVTKLLRRTHPEDIERQLYGSRAELAQFLGWLAFDLNDLDTAKAHFYEGIHAAHQADDEQLAAYILGYLSILAIYDERPTEGLALIDARQRAAPDVRSWLATVTAEAHANFGDAYQTEKALERAELAIRKSKREDNPAWLYHYDRSGLTSAAGTCWLVLGQGERARVSMNETLKLSGPSVVREQSLYLARLGQSYVLDGDTVTAASLGGQALDIARDTDSPRGVQRVRGLWKLLARDHRDEPAVRELDEKLREAEGTA